MQAIFFTSTLVFVMLATALAVQNFPQIGGGTDFVNLIDQVETADGPLDLSTTPSDFEDFSSGGTDSGGDFANFPTTTFVDFGEILNSVDVQDTFDPSTLQTFQNFQNLNDIVDFPQFDPPVGTPPGESGPGFSLCLVLFSICVGTCPLGSTCGTEGGQCTCIADNLPPPPPPPVY